ncbi:MAG: DNA polymerase III subunit chi [Gammaproteobacteria bacterium]|nr:DNA polymerase III subunit chi [Gammaproteobacteria bacterium]
MTRVDFYVLPETVTDPLPTAVRLCDKAAAAGLFLYAQVPDTALAQALDTALWSQRQGSFISHERHRHESPAPPLPMVLIGSGEPPEAYLQLLLNLDQAVPGYFSRCERVLEIVAGDAAARKTARTHFKFYRDRGYSLTTHNLGTTGVS